MNARTAFRRLAKLAAITTLLLQPACAREKPVLRVGINAWPPFEFLYLAQEKGFYRAEGVEVRIIEFNSFSDARRAYERGQIDAVATTVVELLQMRDTSPRAPQIVQIVDYSNGGDVILARRGISSFAELRGRRVGVELSALGIYVLARGLERNGMSLADVEAVAMDQIAMADALRKNEVDAVVTFPPASTKLVRDNQAAIIFTTAEIPGEVLDLIAVEEDIIRSRPRDVASFLRGFHRAIAYAEEDPADAYRTMAEREGLTAEEFTAELTNGVRLVHASEQAEYLRPGGKVAATIDAADRILRQSGQIKGPDRRRGLLSTAFVAKELAR